jgi:hypothetical protein
MILSKLFMGPANNLVVTCNKNVCRIGACAKEVRIISNPITIYEVKNRIKFYPIKKGSFGFPRICSEPEP